MNPETVEGEGDGVVWGVSCHVMSCHDQIESLEGKEKSRQGQRRRLLEMSWWKGKGVDAEIAMSDR